MQNRHIYPYRTYKQRLLSLLLPTLRDCVGFHKYVWNSEGGQGVTLWAKALNLTA